MGTKAKQILLVRAGQGGRLVDDFVANNRVFVGWHRLGDLRALGGPPHKTIIDALLRAYPEDRTASGRPSKHSAEILDFAVGTQPGDLVVTVAPKRRVFLVGEITGPYEYLPDSTWHSPGYSGEQATDEPYRHSLPVWWQYVVNRDDLARPVLKELDQIGKSTFLLKPETAVAIQQVPRGSIEEFWPSARSSILPEDLLPTAEPVDLQRRTEKLLLGPPRSMPAGNATPPQVTLSGRTAIGRSPEVAAWVRNQANGLCGLCGNPAPFQTAEGIPYLEVHHIKWLSLGGADTPMNAIALCPNCHRRVHHSAERESLQEELERGRGGLVG